jgi:hypothetical protein
MGLAIDKPRVLDEPTCATIIQYLCEGNYLGVALAAAGVTPQTFHYWERRCKENDPSVPKAVADFFDKVWRCQSIAEVASLRAVKEGEKNWSGNAWFLERRFPKRWAKDKSETKPTDSNVDKLNQMIDEMERDQKSRGTAPGQARGQREPGDSAGSTP